GSSGYFRFEDAEEVAPDRELEPGFAIAGVDEKAKQNGRFVLTHHGYWVPVRDLVPLTPFLFHGEEVKEGKLDFGLVAEDRVAVCTGPTGAKRVSGKDAATRAGFERIDVLEEKQSGRDKTGGYLRIADGAWVRARDVRRPTLAPPPESVKAEERWI